MTREISVKVKPSASLLKDIVITAVEGGIGYWCQVEQFKWEESYEDACARLGHNPDEMVKDKIQPHQEELEFPLVTGLEPVNDADFKRVPVLTQDHVLDGLEKLLNNAKMPTRGALVLQAIIEDDAGYLDSEDCDVIIQYGLFGELVYG